MEKNFDSNILTDEEVVEFIAYKLTKKMSEIDPSIAQINRHEDFIKILTKKTLIKISEYAEKIIDINGESILGETMAEFTEGNKK